MIINKKIVYARKKEEFELLIPTIPEGLNPVVFIEDTREMWTCGTYFSIGYPSIEVSEVSGSVKVQIGNSFFLLTPTGDSISLRKGDGNRIIISSNALNRVDTEPPLKWDASNRKLLHMESGVASGSYGQSTNLGNASVFVVPNFIVDATGHITFAENHNIEIRDYVEQVAPSNQMAERNVLLSYNEANNNMDTSQVRKANGLTFNDATQRITIAGGMTSDGAVTVNHGDVSVLDGYIIGKLKGDVEGQATPKIHLSLKPEYGGASTKLYGHVKLQDILSRKPDPSSDNENINDTNVVAAIAASPLMVWNAIETAKSYADSILGSNNAMVFKGALEAGISSPGTYTPMADVGNTYVVTFGSGAYRDSVGYINGVSVEVGDLLICKEATAASDGTNWEEVSKKWTYVQTNTTGVVSGPSSSTIGQLAVFDSITGKLIKGLPNGSVGQMLVINESGIPTWANKPDRLYHALSFQVKGVEFTSFDGYEAKKVNFIAGDNMFITPDNQGNLTLAADPGNDTVNTAGATDLINTKLFLIGAESQTESPQTYSNRYVYVGADNCLYSDGKKVSTTDHTHPIYVTLDTEQTINGSKTFTTPIISTVASGTAPLVVASNTLVSNLNADLLDGLHAKSFIFYKEEDFDPATYDGYYMGMTTKSGINGNWWHIISMNWGGSNMGIVGNKTWVTQLALPTKGIRGLKYRTGNDSTSYGSWVDILDVTNYAGTLDGRYLKKTGDTMTGTLTSASTSSSIVFKGLENCDITNIYKDNGVIKNDDGGLTSIRNGLRFNWYDTYWYIGNLRGGSTESAGFGVVDHNNKLVLRVTPNDVRAPRFMSTVATGLSPLIVSSNTLVNNLNSNYLEGYNKFGFIHSNYSASTSGTKYVSGDTHIMLIAEIDINTIYSTYVVLLSNEFWGHQHYSALQLHIACTNNDDNGNKSPKCSVNVMSRVGSHVRSVYYKVENNKAYIFIKVEGGNSYGRWASTILQNYDSITTNNANTTGNIKLKFAFNQANSGLTAARYDNYISSTGLVTSRTLWGQYFNGTANVSGDMTGVGSINMSGVLTIANSTYNKQLVIRSTGSTAKNQGEGIWFRCNAADQEVMLRHEWYDTFVPGYGLAVSKHDSLEAGDANMFFYNTGRFISKAPQGTSPYQCVSTTVNANLNADLLDGVHLAGLSGREGVMRSWLRGRYTTVNQYFGNGNVVTIDPKPTDDATLSANTTVLSLGDLPTRNTQLAFHYDTNTIKYRRHDDSNWNDWVVLIHSGNYASYSDGRYVKKAGDTMTGTLGMGANTIYWKENGSGDKFGLTPYFSGTNDNNYLAFMSSVGEAGTDPAMSAKMVLTGLGNVGIGTTTPTQKLHVIGGGLFTALLTTTGITNNGTLTQNGDIRINQASTTGTRQVRFQGGVNDYGRIAFGATAGNEGWMEIASCDDGNEPIYARQYTGVFTTIKRTATLLDANGNTIFPGTVTAPTFTGALNGTAEWSKRLATNSQLTFGLNGLTYFNANLGAGTAANQNVGPTAQWWHILRMNRGNGSGYFADIAVPLNTSDGIYWRRIQGGTNYGWYRVLDTNNYAGIIDGRYVNVTGDTMTGALHLANGTRNNAGDDCGFGDCNIGGCLGLQGLNGATGLAFIQRGASWSGGNNYRFTWNGSNMTSSSTAQWNNLNADLLDGYHQEAFSMGWTTSTKYRVDRWGGGTDKSWKKIVTYVCTGGGKYQSCKVKGTIYYIIGDHNQGHVVDIPFEAIMYAYSRTENLMLNQSTLYLPPYCTWDMIRIVRYNNNSWEVQVRQPSDWTNISLEYTATNSGGSVSAGQFTNTSYSSTVANNYNTNVSRPTSSYTNHAASADRLTIARSINGTNFDGTANITTSYWGTARNFTIGNTTKSVNGSANVSWSFADIGGAPANHSHNYINSRGNLNPQTGRTQNLGNVYSYNTASGTSSGAPTTYTSVIGFGRSTAGTVEIAGGWTAGMGLWYRALRDATDNWYGWVKVWDTKNFDPNSKANSNHNHDGSYITKGGSNNNVVLGAGGYKALSDFTLNSNWAASKNASGYVKFPNGFIIQWGEAYVGANSTGHKSFPIAFPTACISVQVTHKTTAINWDKVCVAGNYTRTSCTIANCETVNSMINWMALGY